MVTALHKAKELGEGDSTMIGKGLFHTHLVVSNLEKSLKFYTGLFGMQKINFEGWNPRIPDDPGARRLISA